MLIEAIAIGTLFYLGHLAGQKYTVSEHVENVISEPMDSSHLSNTIILPQISSNDPFEIHNKMMVELNEAYKHSGKDLTSHYDGKTTNISDYYRRPNFINTDV